MIAFVDSGSLRLKRLWTIGLLFITFYSLSNSSTQSPASTENESDVTSVNALTTESSHFNPTTGFPHTETLRECIVFLANDATYKSVRDDFKGISGNGRKAVYISLKVQDSNGTVRPFGIYGDDTFAPDQWVWASAKGKNLLPLPLDYAILSLGILSIGTVNMDILLDESTEICFNSTAVPYNQTVHILTKFLVENVTMNGTDVDKDSDGPVVCRSANAFSSSVLTNRRIGYKCCAPPRSDLGMYVCETPYTISWKMVLVGSIILFLIYAIFTFHFYTLYGRSFYLKRIRDLSLQKIKSNVVNRIARISEDLTNSIPRISEDLSRIRPADELIALRERAQFLDVLGFVGNEPSCMKTVYKVFALILPFLLFYGATVFLLYAYYRQLRTTIFLIKDSDAVLFSIYGHLGWLFSDNKQIFCYAFFEFIYTLLIPPIAVLIRLFLSNLQDAADFEASTTRPEELELESLNNNESQKNCMPAFICCKKCLLRFMVSRLGKILKQICFALYFIYVFIIGGIFLAFVAFFVGLGVFSNIDVISPYILPIVVCHYYIAASFSPAYYEHRIIKDTIFSVCLEKESQLLIRKHKEIFLRRKIVSDFYAPNSFSTICSCIERILIVVALMMLVIFIILTLQYPYSFQVESIAAFLGVQIAFFLPLLSDLVIPSSQFTKLEMSTIRQDIEAYIERCEKEHREALAVAEGYDNAAGPSSDDAVSIA